MDDRTRSAFGLGESLQPHASVSEPDLEQHPGALEKDRGALFRYRQETRAIRLSSRSPTTEAVSCIRSICFIHSRWKLNQRVLVSTCPGHLRAHLAANCATFL